MKIAIEFRKKELSELEIKDLVDWNININKYCDFGLVRVMRGMKNYFIVFDQCYVQHDLVKLYSSNMLYLDIKPSDMDFLFITGSKFNSLKEMK